MRQRGENFLKGLVGNMSVDVLVRLIESDTQLRIAAESEGFVHTYTEHGDQDVQRYIPAL
jgi:hypothetical protein